MYQNSAHDFVIQQAGLIQKGELNTSIPNHLLQTAVMTQGRNKYHQVQAGKPSKSVSTWLLSLIANLIWKTERAYDNLAEAAR